MAYKKGLGRLVEARAIELYTKKTSNKTEIARMLVKEFNLDEKEYSIGLLRKRIANLVNKETHSPEPVKIKKKIIDKSEKFTLPAWDAATGRIMNITEYCDKYNLPSEDIKDYKLVTHTGTPYYNIHFKENLSELAEIFNEDFLDGVIKKHISPVKIKTIDRNESDKVLRAIYTDVHIGMSPNPDGNSLFGGVWNEDELMSRLRFFCHDITERAYESGAKVLILDDLGDFMDGFEGKTVRNLHDLPQNMTTSEAFEVGIKFKVSIIDHLMESGLFGRIVMNNICNDNHAGVFGYLVNHAVKKIIESKYSAVEVVNHQKFIVHYTVGRHCFIICHGKDDKLLKFGFGPQLNEKLIGRIDGYMKANNLFASSDWFEFSKGDSHQMLFDYSGSDDFNYMNYPAFSPSSDWVQTNYKRGKSGYVLQVIDPDAEEIAITYRMFKWKVS